MPKRTIILIGIIGIIASLLTVAALIQLKKGTDEQMRLGTEQALNEKTPTKTSVEKTVSFSFSPLQVTASSTPVTVELLVDTGGKKIIGVQMELKYDPTKITNVSLIPASPAASLFGATGQNLIDDIRPEAGRISYAVVINPTAEQVNGIGSIATLRFQAVSGATGNTEITFLETSLATSLESQKSALKGTVPLIVTLSSSQLANPQVLPQNSPTTPAQ